MSGWKNTDHKCFSNELRQGLTENCQSEQMNQYKKVFLNAN